MLTSCYLTRWRIGSMKQLKWTWEDCGGSFRDRDDHFVCRGQQGKNIRHILAFYICYEVAINLSFSYSCFFFTLKQKITANWSIGPFKRNRGFLVEHSTYIFIEEKFRSWKYKFCPILHFLYYNLHLYKKELFILSQMTKKESHCLY